MRILLINRDITETNGIMWYMKSYIPGSYEIHACYNVIEASKLIETFQPKIIILELDIFIQSQHTALFHLLKQNDIQIIALSAQPLFSLALKAIELQVAALYLKPVELEQLKGVLLSLITKHKDVKLVETRNDLLLNESFYLQLFLDDVPASNHLDFCFLMIEPEEKEELIPLYNWLRKSVFFESIHALPLSKYIVCFTQKRDLKLVNQEARSFMKEWNMTSNVLLNFGIYDLPHTSVKKMYEQTQQALNQRFYEGFGQIYYVSKKLQTVPFDPLLTPEEQQLWIRSLETGDIQTIKNTLYQLSNSGIYYEEDDLRIHLTSVLAQIRRFMQKYHLHEKAPVEQNYRQLFHLILEHPIFYTIINEIIIFTQSLMNLAKQEQKTDYIEIAIEILNKRYQNPKLSLEAVAKELGISASYLSALFSKKQGLPFKRFLQQLRINKSIKTLIETEFSISEVAIINGFEDCNYFIKIFKKYVGLTPNKYRNIYSTPNSLQ